MKVIPRGGTWQVHFEDAAGDRKRLSTKVKVDPSLPDKGKAEARLVGAELAREALLQATDAPKNLKAGKNTLAYALMRTMRERWEGTKSANTTRYNVTRLAKEVGYWPLASIDYDRLKTYGLELAEAGDSPATRNRKMSLLHTAIEEAWKRKEIPEMPHFPRWKEAFIKERYLTYEEERALAASMARHTPEADDFGRYMMLAVPFLLDTGLRAGELLLTRTQDLGDRIWLPHGSTKSGRGRSVPLTPRARECLTALLASPVHRELQDLYWKDKAIPSQRLGRRFKLEVARAGIEGVTLHTLRHTCASRLVQAGVSLYAVKEWLGHSTIQMTERYAHLAPSSLDSAAAALAAARVSHLQSTVSEAQPIPEPIGTTTPGFQQQNQDVTEIAPLPKSE